MEREASIRMDEDFKKKIEDDLLTSGVGSELQAIQAFRAAEWSVTGASYFVDRDENKSREVDLVASKNVEYKFRESPLGKKGDFGSWLSYSMIVAGEVKKSKHPWVVLRESVDPDKTYEGWLNLIHSYNLPVESPAFTKEIDSTSLAKIDGRVGVGIHESFKKPDSRSRWFVAAVSACKAAEHLLSYHKQTRAEESRSFDPGDDVDFLLVKPIVVVDSRLLAAEIGADGETVVSEIDWAPLRFEFTSPGYDRGRYHPDCVSLSALGRYIEILDKRWSHLLESIGKGLPEFDIAACKRYE